MGAFHGNHAHRDIMRIRAEGCTIQGAIGSGCRNHGNFRQGEANLFWRGGQPHHDARLTAERIKQRHACGVRFNCIRAFAAGQAQITRIQKSAGIGGINQACSISAAFVM